MVVVLGVVVCYLILYRNRFFFICSLSLSLLKGIITETDFVAVAINLLEQLEDSEPDDEFAETG